MYRLEMYLSVDGAEKGSKQMIFHQVICSLLPSDIARGLTYASQTVPDLLLPKDNPPGRPVAAPEASTPGADTYVLTIMGKPLYTPGPIDQRWRADLVETLRSLGLYISHT